MLLQTLSRWTGASAVAIGFCAITAASASAQESAPRTRERALGSLVPCAVPLPWRVTQVDPRFGLSVSEAKAAVEEAGALWEHATGRDLFRNDAEQGLPIRFEFDDRQATLQLRNRLLGELAETDRELAVRRERLQSLSDSVNAIQAAYLDRAGRLRDDTDERNRTVRSWNGRGGAPPDVRDELERSERRLDRERETVQRMEQALRDTNRRLQTLTDDLNRAIHARNDGAETVEQQGTVRASESGRYGESVRTRNAEVVSLEREILIFRFAGPEDLVQVIAHELGHALGLGHAPSQGAVMSEVLPALVPRAGGIRLSPTDLEMLRSTCPDL